MKNRKGGMKNRKKAANTERNEGCNERMKNRKDKKQKWCERGGKKELREVRTKRKNEKKERWKEGKIRKRREGIKKRRNNPTVYVETE